jgi:hypothetical protein
MNKNWMPVGYDFYHDQFSFLVNIKTERGLNAFPITETEFKLIAGALMIGLSNIPVTEYSTPAAIDLSTFFRTHTHAIF